ncbi:MAG: MupG family TIM beta-alpha barrel fold protein [Lactobacillaceae bacterium]|jgi:hypothetical protein|nr:MupG family TIM beta-alpha barrel fold protein [Lactobacillaceae bacterium]
MGEMGVSVYLTKDNLQENIEYLKKAASKGYTKIFTSMLEIVGDSKEYLNLFKSLITTGNELGMKTTVDINPELFADLGISYQDLKFFADLGAWGVRLDIGFTGQEESLMSHNPYGIMIETNISRGTHYIDLIMDYAPNVDQLIGSHNFYPQKYTGLGRTYFQETSQKYNSYHLKTSAFVNAPTGENGPWPVVDGLVTLEDHRNLSIGTQVQDLRFSGLINDIVIGNAYASDEELDEAIKAFRLTRPRLRVIADTALNDVDKKVLFGQALTYRGDFSDYVLRSSETRVIYKNEDFPAKNTVDIKPYDLLIGNNDFGQYKGELQIARKDFKNDGRINVVGHIHPDDLEIFHLIKPWGNYDLVEA